MLELMVKDSTYWMKLQVVNCIIIQAVMAIYSVRVVLCLQPMWTARAMCGWEALKVMYTVAMPSMGNFGHMIHNLFIVLQNFHPDKFYWDVHMVCY